MNNTETPTTTIKYHVVNKYGVRNGRTRTVTGEIVDQSSTGLTIRTGRTERGTPRLTSIATSSIIEVN